MQVERIEGSLLPDISGGRVSNTWATCPADGDNSGKPGLIPNNRFFRMEELGKTGSAVTAGWARGALASWWGDGLPRRRCVADLRGWSATVVLGQGRDSCGRQPEGSVQRGR